ncbi:hypothetical protein, partial [Halomonas marinisediminis]|uniref:hypothetical protein n=1 Tax=Halomonas marinisediminis TaxID=2546095 RepID=UPI00140489B2
VAIVETNHMSWRYFLAVVFFPLDDMDKLPVLSGHTSLGVVFYFPLQVTVFGDDFRSYCHVVMRSIAFFELGFFASAGGGNALACIPWRSSFLELSASAG